MNKLEEIVLNTRKEVEVRKGLISERELEKSNLFIRIPKSLQGSLKSKEGKGIIAEYKRKSPSKGFINQSLSPTEVGTAYEANGAAGISCLTDLTYFDGKNEYLTQIKREVNIPVLRKDFIVDEYQVIEAKSIGADAILLIAACLSPAELKSLAQLADNVGLEVLMEVHGAEEIESHFNQFVNVVGVNNRNLKTMDVSIQTSLDIVNLLPDSVAKISESGLREPETLSQLKAAGYDGFLIGETFMATSNPGETLKNLIDQIQ